jgi:predicted transposase YbfD/YdcC
VLRASRQREVDSKSNEITAVPELLDTLHLDAMGCQKDDTLPELRIINGRFCPTKKVTGAKPREPARVRPAGRGSG